MLSEESLAVERELMVVQQIKARGLTDEHLLNAFRIVPRHRFVPEDYIDSAYDDFPLPVGCGQTISQPYIVALMTHLLQLKGKETVLEVGTGSGYQTAILSRLVKKVYTIEIFPELAQHAAEILTSLKYDNIEVITGDGSGGLPEHAPYDAILITAGAPEVPPPLIGQLAKNGRIVLPAGPRFGQELEVWQVINGIGRCQKDIPVVFVPLRGEYGWKAGEEE
jgi:protein-L-isoaspartate(D-aspartate) O-methyltransferase